MQKKTKFLWPPGSEMRSLSKWKGYCTFTMIVQLIGTKYVQICEALWAETRTQSTTHIRDGRKDGCILCPPFGAFAPRGTIKVPMRKDIYAQLRLHIGQINNPNISHKLYIYIYFDNIFKLSRILSWIFCKSKSMQLGLESGRCQWIGSYIFIIGQKIMHLNGGHITLFRCIMVLLIAFRGIVTFCVLVLMLAGFGLIFNVTTTKMLVVPYPHLILNYLSIIAIQ